MSGSPDDLLNHVEGATVESLNDIGKRCGANKCDSDHTFNGRTYLDVYDAYLAKMRLEPVNVLELGVGNGGSLRMWRDYFPRAQVYGLDNDPAIDIQEDRISTFFGSQSDTSVLSHICEVAGPFDVVVDDASHLNDKTVVAFRFLIEHVSKSGIYSVEDVDLSYRDLSSQVNEWGGELARNVSEGASLRNDRGILEELFLEIISDLDHRRGSIDSIHFHSRLVIIQKGGDRC